MSASAFVERNRRILAIYNQGYTLSFTARQVGVTIGVVAAVVRREIGSGRRRQWGKNPDRSGPAPISKITHAQVIADRFSDGRTYPEIAARHGLTRRQAYRLVNEVAL